MRHASCITDDVAPPLNAVHRRQVGEIGNMVPVCVTPFKQAQIVNMDSNRAGILASTAYHALKGKFFLDVLVADSPDEIHRLHFTDIGGHGQLACIDANPASWTGKDFDVIDA